MIRFMMAVLAALGGLAATMMSARAEEAPAHGHYANFRVAIYVTVGSTRRLADPEVFAREFERAYRQVPFDKVWVEVYRNHQFASDDEIEAVSRMFRERGITVEGGLTPAAGGQGGQFGTFDFENPADMAECRRAAELAARHFDQFILDDFFFYNSKSAADIAARGDRSWSDYRVARMREVSRQCILDPAHAVNPHARVIIKYPNWYEHFHGTGFDLAEQPALFGGIYTGTETRDPEITDQTLQQYESYEIFRYFSNIRPDHDGDHWGNGGGWVDTYSTRYVDRYAEQLWLTLFAKAPEITLFEWNAMSGVRPLEPGARPWANRATSFNWRAMQRAYHSSGRGDPGAGWGAVAGYALAQIDQTIGALGRPIGIASYRPAHAVGEDFLHNFLGNVGIPIELYPAYPKDAETVLLTQAAAVDPGLVDEVEASLRAGHRVIMTSGLVCALDGHGLERIVDLDCTGRRVALEAFYGSFGAGSGGDLSDPPGKRQAVTFPEIRFFTNDSWPIIRGVAHDNRYPIMLSNSYEQGQLLVLNIPDNPGDLYVLPRALLDQIRAYVSGDFPVRIEADAHVALFAYDNGTFIVHSFRDAPEDVVVSLPGAEGRLADALSGAALSALAPPPAPQFGPAPPPRTRFVLTLEPHSFRVLRIVH